MTKKQNDNFYSDWANAISNMKMQIEVFYEKDDKQKERAYKVNGVSKDFNSSDEYVLFHSIRTESIVNYVMKKDEFINRFERVIEEI